MSVAGLASSGPVRAVPHSGQSSSSPATLIGSEEFLMAGPGGRSFKIQISYPEPDDPDLELPIKGRKPVPIYVLDGGYSFGMFASIARYMQWGGELPPCMVVGIGYQDQDLAYENDFRLHDFTPDDPTWEGSRPEYLRGKVGKAGDIGGGPAFRDFLVDALRPHIEERFDVDASQSLLFGHSLGGLFVLNTMLEAPGAFRNLLAISPALWFADRALLRRLQDALESSFVVPGNVAVYVGEREERIARAYSRMTSNVLDLARIVAEHRSSFGRVAVSVLPEQSHHSIVAPAASLGLRFLLSPEEKRAETY
jgi:hypothetical protein